jgi:Domain of unknown function (DUF4352)
VGRRRFIAFALCLGLFAFLSIGADSCTTETKNTASGGKNSGQKAAFGDPITLEGNESALKMEVTPTKVEDPLSVGSFDQPTDKGNRFVGVEVTLKNVGTKTYNDSPSNGATVVAANGQQGSAAILSGGPCAGDFATQSTISPGSVRVGCIPFELPGSSPVKTFQFTLESGFGPQAGEWTVK